MLRRAGRKTIFEVYDESGEREVDAIKQRLNAEGSELHLCGEAVAPSHRVGKSLEVGCGASSCLVQGLICPQGYSPKAAADHD